MPPQTLPNLDDLLRVLNAATDKRALRWTDTPSEDAFRAQFGFGLVRIAKDPDTARYVLTLVDRDGTVLDEYHPSEEATQLAFESLYKKARQQALNLDERLMAFFDHLKSLAERS